MRGYLSRSSRLLTSSAILLLSVLALAYLQNRANAGRDVSMLLARIETAGQRLNAAEWRIAARRTVDEEVEEEIDVARRAAHDALAALERYSGRDLDEVRRYFAAYEAAVDHEIDLLREGHFEEAETFDETRVDPAFTRLLDALHATGTTLSLAAHRTGMFAVGGYVLLTIVVLAALVALTRAVDEGRMRARADEIVRSRLTAEVQARTGDLRRANDELRHAREVADAANRAKSVFLANMSHELRTPLHGLLSFAEFGIRESAPRTPAREYFEQITESGGTLLVLLNDLLDLAKIEAGRLTLHRREIDLGETVSAVLDEIRSLVAQRGLRVEFDRPPESLYMIGDQERLMQVLRNILVNATKFARSLIRVNLIAADGSDEVIIAIEDDGPGIPADEREAVFDKFVQAAASAGHVGGTGLGLAITRELVRAHAGRVTAHESVLGGARFEVLLPLDAVSARGREAA